MALTINIRSGNDADKPSNVSASQLLLATDTHKLYHGNASGAPYGIVASGLDYGALSTTDGTYSGEVLTVTVDTNSVGVGGILAIAADGNFDEADADAVANTRFIVMALESGTGTKKVLFKGRVCNTSWNWTVGGEIYLSTTLGTMTQTAPMGTDDVHIILGWATHADAMFFNPYVAYLERT